VGKGPGPGPRSADLVCLYVVSLSMYVPLYRCIYMYLSNVVLLGCVSAPPAKSSLDSEMFVNKCSRDAWLGDTPDI